MSAILIAFIAVGIATAVAGFATALTHSGRWLAVSVPLAVAYVVLGLAVLVQRDAAAERHEAAVRAACYPNVVTHRHDDDGTATFDCADDGRLRIIHEDH